MAITYGNQSYLGELDEEEERRKAMELLAQQKAAEDARNIQVRKAPTAPSPNELRPKMTQSEMGRLQDLMLKVRAGEITEPTEVQKQQFQNLLVRSPADDLAMIERAKRFQVSSVGVPEGFEAAYTERQNQQAAQIYGSIQRVMDSPDFNDTEREMAIEQLYSRISNIRPSLRKKEPPPPMGDSWDGTFIHPETGDVMGYDRNNKPRVITPYIKSPGYLEKIRQDKKEDALLIEHSKRMIKEADLQASREERIANKRLDLAKDQAAIEVTGKDGKKTYRPMNEDEIDDVIRRSGLSRITSATERSEIRVATPEQLQYGPSGAPPGLPQKPIADLQWREDQAKKGLKAGKMQQDDWDKMYNALPPGAIYVGKDGQPRRKR